MSSAGAGAHRGWDAIESLEHREITVLLSGIRPWHAKTLDAIGALDRQGRVFARTAEAITAARSLLHHSGVITVPPPRRQLANTARSTR